MTLLLCAFKWLASFLMLPGVMIILTAVVLLGMGAVAVVGGGVYRGVRTFFVRCTPRLVTATAPARAWLGDPDRLFPLFIIASFVGASAVMAPQAMRDLFGCDECLPESMRTACKDEAQMEKDRATYEALKAKYGWD